MPTLDELKAQRDALGADIVSAEASLVTSLPAAASEAAATALASDLEQKKLQFYSLDQQIKEMEA